MNVQSSQQPRHLFQQKGFLHVIFPGRTPVGKEGAFGVRYGNSWFCIEYYTTDQEPILENYRGLRAVIWAPTKPINRKGWLRNRICSVRLVYAYLAIDNLEKSVNSWGRTFRTYVRALDAQETYVVQKVTYEAYRDYYATYGRNSLSCEDSVFEKLSKQTERFYTSFSGDMFYFVLKNMHTDEPLAGIACVNCRDVSQSYYISGFTRKDVAPPQAGLWLCYSWFKDSSQKGIKYANLGVLFKKGCPSSWKGFTDFKMKFNPQEYVLFPEMVKVTIGFLNKRV